MKQIKRKTQPFSVCLENVSKLYGTLTAVDNETLSTAGKVPYNLETFSRKTEKG